MRIAVRSILLVLYAAPAAAQQQLPIIDMHLHALAADDQGPPPVAICTPMAAFAAWDPAKPYGQAFMGMLKQPPCEDPVWSPTTDEKLMSETIEVMNRRNIHGVLSGTEGRVAAWMEAAPGRFFPGRARRDNAARFLRLSEREVARHHGR